MKRSVRSSRKGFTLIELMVVILIIGLLAGVIGIAVSGVISGSKVKNDALQLSRFVSNLQLALNENSNRRALKGIKSESAHELFAEMFKKKIVKFDDMKRLAGTSGSAADEAGYGNTDDPLYTQDYCIFTGPANFNDLSALMNDNSGKEVMFTYNHNWIAKYEEEGIVYVKSGASEGQFVVRPQFDTHFDMDKLEGGGKWKEPDSLEAWKEVYGKPPFGKVVKE